MTSGELCKRLREPLKELPTTLSDDEEVLILVAWCKEAADRIEQLEAQVRTLADQIDRIEESVSLEIVECGGVNGFCEVLKEYQRNASAALKETP